MSINWDTYKPDITRLYINGNKTAEETIEYLNEKHGAGITIRKFKSEFGSLKKLQAKEWRAIFQEIRKRKAGGKDSDVYLCGRRLNQSRVDRAKRRYDKAQKADEESLPQVSADGRYIDDVDIHEISYDFSTPTLDNDFVNGLTGTSHVDMHDVINISDQSSSPFLSQSTIIRSNTISSIFELNHEAPRHQRQFLSPHEALPVGVAPSIFNAIPGCSTQFLQPFWNSKDPILRVLHLPASVLENIVVNSKKSGRPNLEVWPSMNMDQKSIYQIFTVIAFLVSNNYLQTRILQIFITWVISNGYFGQLSNFLKDCASGSCEARVFIVKILQAAIPPDAAISIPGNNLFKAHPDELFQLLVALDKNILLGSLGIDLLIAAADSDHFAAVKMLVGQGVDVNGINDQFDRYSRNTSWTPLSRAALHGSLELVIFLIKSGAKVNTQLHGTNTSETALSMAVKKRRVEIVSALFPEVTTVGLHPKTLQDAKVDSPDIYQLLLDKLEADEVRTLLLVEAAERGPENLSQFLLARNIVEDEVLERGLHHAVVGCNARAVRTLLRRGVDPNIPKFRMVTQSATAKGVTREDERMKYILYLIVKAGARLGMKTIKRIQDEVRDKLHFDFYTILFTAGHDVSSIGIKMLVEAASVGNFYQCSALLDMGVPIDAYHRGRIRRSSLQTAALGGHLTLVQYLLDRGANVNLPAYHRGGRTALQAAASQGHSDIIDCLLDAGADVAAPAAKESGLNVLEAAAHPYHPSPRSTDEVIFKKLLALGAPVNRPNDVSGQVLHGLIQSSRFECLKLALRAGARIEDRYLVLPFAPRRLTLTPLQFAAHRLNQEAIQLLLEHGADVNALATDGHTALHPNFGRTALQAAASHEYASPYLVDLLLQRDAAVNAEPAMHGGITAIQGAAINGKLQIARMLLDRGANINAPAALEEGRTAIEGAAEHGRLEMVRLLLRSGALPDPVTGFSTAIAFAKAQSHWGIADLLEESQNAFDPFSLSFCDPLTWASNHVGQDLGMGLIDNEPPSF
ncbi:ankyrin repeat-containing domain protein [Ilyonectria destructans]|nr:ankyrin repeat-containing domain protein [Ilyonectria destructans]